MAKRFNPPPNWPALPQDWTPHPGWQPDPSWPPPPEGWQFWVEKRKRPKWIGAIAVFGIIGLLALIGSIGNDQSTGEATATPTIVATTRPSPTTASLRPPAVVPTTTKPKPRTTTSRPRRTTAAPTPRKRRPPVRNCDSNYRGACVPVASDVDCAGGSGNGPKYFGGVARVTGSDVYDLDADGDGLACEPPD